MLYLPGIFSLIVLASGWYYLFYSPAAHRLASIETHRQNIRRIRLRRANGIVMMLLAVTFYAAMYTVNEQHSAVWTLVGIIVLMSAMLVLALIDLQLTRKVRRQQEKVQL